MFSTWYGRCQRYLLQTLALNEIFLLALLPNISMWSIIFIPFFKDSGGPNINGKKKVGHNSTQCSQEVTHPSTDWALCCLTSVIKRELVFSTWYGRCLTSTSYLPYQKRMIDTLMILCFSVCGLRSCPSRGPKNMNSSKARPVLKPLRFSSCLI